MESVLAGFIMVSLALYALSGGADLGAGVWDLLASGPRSKDQRLAIERAVIPIWEANHVWLLLVFITLIIAFPTGFWTVVTALAVPLLIIVVTLMVRGGSFILRAVGRRLRQGARGWRKVFALTSTIAPIAMGMAAGAVASGQIDVDPITGLVRTDYVSEWLAPFPIVAGCFTLALFAFLAAVYLTNEVSDEKLQDDFRGKAMAAQCFTGGLALLTILLAKEGAPIILDALGKQVWAVPFHIATGGAATGAMWMLATRRFGLARVFAVAQVALIVFGWGLAQFPYVVIPHVTVFNGAASDSVLRITVIAMALCLMALVPAMWFLIKAFKWTDASDS